MPCIDISNFVTVSQSVPKIIEVKVFALTGNSLETDRERTLRITAFGRAQEYYKPLEFRPDRADDSRDMSRESFNTGPIPVKS
jgi:hypothetical protein